MRKWGAFIAVMVLISFMVFGDIGSALGQQLEMDLEHKSELLGAAYGKVGATMAITSVISLYCEDSLVTTSPFYIQYRVKLESTLADAMKILSAIHHEMAETRFGKEWAKKFNEMEMSMQTTTSKVFKEHLNGLSPDELNITCTNFKEEILYGKFNLARYYDEFFIVLENYLPAFREGPGKIDTVLSG
jgi:hypothetical protein